MHVCQNGFSFDGKWYIMYNVVHQQYSSYLSATLSSFHFALVSLSEMISTVIVNSLIGLLTMTVDIISLRDTGAKWNDDNVALRYEEYCWWTTLYIITTKLNVVWNSLVANGHVFLTEPKISHDTAFSTSWRGENVVIAKHAVKIILD